MVLMTFTRLWGCESFLEDIEMCVYNSAIDEFHLILNVLRALRMCREGCVVGLTPI